MAVTWPRTGTVAMVEGRIAVVVGAHEGSCRWQWLNGDWTTIPLGAPEILGHVEDLRDKTIRLSEVHSVPDLVCPRCGKHTENNSQGHYWAICKVLLAEGVSAANAVREHHFCCPGDCELEAAK